VEAGDAAGGEAAAGVEEDPDRFGLVAFITGTAASVSAWRALPDEPSRQAALAEQLFDVFKDERARAPSGWEGGWRSMNEKGGLYYW